MSSTKEPGWLSGLRAALAEIAVRDGQTGRAAARISQDWAKSYRAMLTKVPTESLLAAYQRTTGEPGDPEADALLAEIERRGLDV